MKRRIFFLILLTNCATSAYAFNYQLCKRYLKNHNALGMEVLVASGSSTSSTGECSLIGNIEHHRKIFLAHNFDQLMADVSKGGGGYLESYLLLSNCSNISTASLRRNLKSNFDSIFKMEEDIEAIDSRIQHLLNEEKSIGTSCSMNRT